MSKASVSNGFTGWHMLFSVVAFFGVIISVNVFMAYSAARTWTGLVVENSYVASQEFNTKLTTARAQAEMGWLGGLEYANGTLVFRLSDANDMPIAAESVTVKLSRPIGTSGDQTVALPPSADGTYAQVLPLDPGAWNAAIVATFADQPEYEHRARFDVGAPE